MRISTNYKLVVLAHRKATWNQTFFSSTTDVSSTIDPIPDYVYYTLLIIPWNPS